MAFVPGCRDFYSAAMAAMMMKKKKKKNSAALWMPSVCPNRSGLRIV